MIISHASLIVNDQIKAMQFYTEILGFQLKHNIPGVDEAGNHWLTVVSPERPDGVELFLSPNDNPISVAFQQGLKAQGIPAIQFAVSDVAAECERLKGLGVEFTLEATDVGPAIIAIFNDTCGNLIQLMKEKGG